MLNSLGEKLVSYVSPSSDGGRADTDNVAEKLQSSVDYDNGGKHKRSEQPIDIDEYSPCVKRRRIDKGFVQKVTSSMAKMAEWLFHSTNYLFGRLDDDPQFDLTPIDEQAERSEENVEEQENGRHVEGRSKEQDNKQLGTTKDDCWFMNHPCNKRTSSCKSQPLENNEYLLRPSIHDRSILLEYPEKTNRLNGNANDISFLYSSKSQKVSMLSQPPVHNGSSAKYTINNPGIRVNCSNVKNVSLSRNKLYSLPCHAKVRNDACNVVWQRPHMHTAAQCVRLEEKERYRQLLQQFSRGDFNNQRSVKSEEKDLSSVTSKTSRSLSITSQDGVSEELKILLPPTDISNEDLNKTSLSELPTPKQKIDFSYPDSSEEIDSEAEKSSESTTSKSRLKKYSASTREQKRKIEEQQIKIKIFEEKRKSQEETLNEEIQQRLQLSEKEPAILEEESDTQEPPSLPEITPAMKSQIDSSLKLHPSNEVLVEGFRIQIKRQDMHTLSRLNWLNDEVINFYLSLLMERSQKGNRVKVHSFNTFFYPKLQSSGYDGVRRWTRKVDIFAAKYLLIPVHLGMHWCLAVVNFSSKTICYYDSMGGENHQCLETIKNYLCEESLDKKKIAFNLVGWITKMARDIPHQMNGSDCGMFVCKYADYITREIPISFTQADMPRFRQLMVYEILKKQLLT